MFETDQKKVYKELNGEADGESVIPDAEESKSFWNVIWGFGREHNMTADWFERLKGDRDYHQQETLEISEVIVKNKVTKFQIGSSWLRWHSGALDKIGYDA